MRYLSKGIKRLWEKDVVNYGRIGYYPRKSNHQDPPIEPSKLFMIERVKPYKGQPWWDKEILDTLKLDPKSPEKIAIVKNTPDMCSILHRIKHLIKITPIKLPKKLPENFLTNNESYIHENGNLMIFPRADKNRMEASEKFENNPKKLDPETLKKYLRDKWMNPMESNGSVK